MRTNDKTIDKCKDTVLSKTATALKIEIDFNSKEVSHCNRFCVSVFLPPLLTSTFLSPPQPHVRSTISES